MGGRGFLYCVLIALLICGCLTVAVTAAFALRDGGWLEDVSFGAESVLIMGGGLGFTLLVVWPVFGLIYRYDQAVFQQMMRPRYHHGAQRAAKPVPPVSGAMLRQLAQWLARLGLLAEVVLRVVAWAAAGAGWLPGVLLAVGVWLAGCALLGGRLYLRLRDTGR